MNPVGQITVSQVLNMINFNALKNFFERGSNVNKVYLASNGFASRFFLSLEERNLASQRSPSPKWRKDLINQEIILEGLISHLTFRIGIFVQKLF